MAGSPVDCSALRTAAGITGSVRPGGLFDAPIAGGRPIWRRRSEVPIRSGLRSQADRVICRGLGQSSDALGNCRQPIDGRRQPVTRRPSSPVVTSFVMKVGPVVHMRHEDSFVMCFLDMPSPNMTDRSAPGSAGIHAISRPSSNSTTWFSRIEPPEGTAMNTSPTPLTR